MDLTVLLINIGGVKSYWKYPFFLFRMFTDESILPLPFALRYPIALSISLFRVPFVLPKYFKIGGSPLIDQMKVQAEELEAYLKRKDYKAKVLYANLYSEPLLKDVVKLIDYSDKVIVLPLYPQYSMTTTGAVLNKLAEYNIKFKLIRDYHDHPEFIQLWSDVILKYWKDEFVIFVAHSIPERYVDKGDPYKDQIYRSAHLIAQRCGIQNYAVAFQSRIGPVKWLEPDLEDVLLKLKNQLVDKVLLVPISFLNEHLETLYDLDIAYKEKAKNLGFSVYKRLPVPWREERLYKLFTSKIREALS